MSKIEVIFKVEEGDILAVFPSLKERGGRVTCYAHIGQHGAACPSYIENLEDATAHQSEALRAELVAIGYQLEEVK